VAERPLSRLTPPRNIFALPHPARCVRCVQYVGQFLRSVVPDAPMPPVAGGGACVGAGAGGRVRARVGVVVGGVCLLKKRTLQKGGMATPYNALKMRIFLIFVRLWVWSVGVGGTYTPPTPTRSGRRSAVAVRRRPAAASGGERQRGDGGAAAGEKDANILGGVAYAPIRFSVDAESRTTTPYSGAYNESSNSTTADER